MEKDQSATTKNNNQNTQMEQFRTHFKEANKTSQVSVEPTRTTKGRETKEYMVQSTEIRPEENWQNL